MSKKPSFEKINYTLRPAKAVERKMISFALRKLSVFDSLKNYQYIGFGSTFFYDFLLFHKELSIKEMISIEIEEGKEDRFQFNKPFDCIELMMGSSNDILPIINWDRRAILWLDYDQKLAKDNLLDIATFCTSAISGSVFLITVNCQSGRYGKENEDRRNTLISDLGDDKLPLTQSLSDFSDKVLPITLKTIIEDEINSKIRESNGLRDNSEKLTYQPVFSFIYRDGAKMMTIGGVVLNESDKAKFNTANFSELDFYRDDNSFFDIKIPSITLKEIRFLNSQLPNGINEKGEFVNKELIEKLNPNIPEVDIRNYSKIYKFFPVFSETFYT